MPWNFLTLQELQIFRLLLQWFGEDPNLWITQTTYMYWSTGIRKIHYTIFQACLTLVKNFYEFILFSKLKFMNSFSSLFIFYRCKEMADNCGKCLSLDEKFGCGWCQSSGKCEVKDKCGNDASSWLNRDQTCPNPQVTSFEPMLGPWEGNSIHSF